MTALNLRDESAPVPKVLPEVPKEQDTPKAGVAAWDEVSAELTKLVAGSHFIRHLYLLDAGGRLLGVGRAERAMQDLPLDLHPLQGLIAAHAGGDLKRTFLEFESGIVVLLRLAETRWLAAACDKGASLGTVSVGIGRLMARLFPSAKGGGKPATVEQMRQPDSAAEREAPRARASGE
jgi:hypothetical protein